MLHDTWSMSSFWDGWCSAWKRERGRLYTIEYWQSCNIVTCGIHNFADSLDLKPDILSVPPSIHSQNALAPLRYLDCASSAMACGFRYSLLKHRDGIRAMAFLLEESRNVYFELRSLVHIELCVWMGYHADERYNPLGLGLRDTRNLR